MKALVSILIPAHNASRWIAATIRSAQAQTWSRKEIIVVDDGSSDDTVAVARRFECSEVQVVTKGNEGAAATRNAAMAMSRGQYIQWLDADDLLSPGKIECQLDTLKDAGDERTLLSCPWAYFAYRPQKARFKPTSLWHDLAPVEWLLRKMGENLHMQTATWLTSRDLALAAGHWDLQMLSDDDGEYFCRVLLASSGVRFVPGARVYYRKIAANRLSFIGTSSMKMDSMLVSLKLHIQYLRSLEDSPRVHRACVAYLQNWTDVFDPARMDIHQELQAMASQLGGSIDAAGLRRKYRWIKHLLGHRAAWRVQLALPHTMHRLRCNLDKMVSSVDRPRMPAIQS